MLKSHTSFDKRIVVKRLCLFNHIRITSFFNSSKFEFVRQRTKGHWILMGIGISGIVVAIHPFIETVESSVVGGFS